VLTGDPAFTGRSGGEIHRKAALGDLADALGRLDRCGADAELVALAKDCLAREAEDRPRDASEMAERVTAYLAGVQERLVTTEVARAGEAARAEEAGHTARAALARALAERKARRFQAGMAASILALMMIGGLRFTYWLQQRQIGTARVERLLGEARLLRDQAGAEADDVARWEKARDALSRAESDLADQTDPNVRATVQALRSDVQVGLDTAVADRTLLATLVDIRSARADDPDGSATDASYVDAFRAAGIDPDALDPSSAGARIGAKPQPVARAMVAALDHWTGVREQRGANGEGWTRLIAAARAADPDPDHDALRSALLIKDRPARLERLRPLAERASLVSWAPASLVSLGSALADAGAVDEGVTVLKKASGTYPTDALVHYLLGGLLERRRPPQPDEAIRAYSVARALQPELASHELAHALDDHGKGEEAEAVFRDLVRRRPDNARHLGCCGRLLKDRGRGAEATAMLDRAIIAGRTLTRLKPDDAAAHGNLGIALHSKGKFDEAVAELREAIRLEPDNATAFIALGTALMNQGKIDEAVSAYREAIRLQPENAMGHYDLGNAVRAEGKTDEAVVAFREAIRLKPDFAEAHCNLGLVLRRTGAYRDALDELRRGHEHGSKKTGWSNPSAKWVRDAEQAVALSERLPAILNGEDKPKNAADALSFATLCQARGWHAAATRLLAQALAAEPKLGDDRRTQYRYNGACAAVQAGCGKSKDNPAPDVAAQAELRRQALEWLTAELAAWTKTIDSGDPKTRAQVARTLLHWNSDPDLAGIRDADALAKLPKTEGDEWLALWADVEALRKRAGEKGP
jgi:tetratricopeptide (TPR) repeat protein